MCELCGDVGYYRVEQDLPGDVRHYRLIRCPCKAVEDAARLQRLSGLTESERTITLDQIETLHRPGTQVMVSSCRAFMAAPYGMVTFWGGSGNAKTMALQAVVNWFVDDNVEAVYITAFDLVSHIREAFGKDHTVRDDSAYERLVRFGNVRVLAVDEFDKVHMTDWVTEQLTDLIDRRYRLGQSSQAGTLLAMNGDPRTLPPWMASRLSQGIVHHNTDGDMRPLFGELAFTHPQTGEVLG